MVFLPQKLRRVQLQHQVLHSRDTDDNGSWGLMQITTPIIVGVTLIVIFSVYIIWYRRSPHDFRVVHHYKRFRDACFSRFAKVFMSEHRCREVQNVTTPITLDDSMATPRHTRRPHTSYSRSDSTDSQTPLTESAEFYYPPQRYIFDPFGRPMLKVPQQPEKRTWRWWRVFGPREVKSQLPSHRFQIEGPDESSVGHGESSVGHGDGSLEGLTGVAVRSRWTSNLGSLPEHDEGDPHRGFYDRVIQIGDPELTVHSTSVALAHYERAAEVVTPGSAPTSVKTPAPEYSSAVEYPGPYLASNQRTMATAPMTIIQSSHHTPQPTLPDSPAPPMYSSIPRNSRPSMENITHHARSDPTMLYPGPVRGAGRSSPQHIYQAHERQISTESVLASSTPMVTSGLY
ncbi:hypothetical protein AZE42_03824 [Rhizopogon vesiculosus]|uniref:Transmembrane protein n=1 Tax=Rhizopogon vesiculosus TaxID=180088 RepID=A0A1J8QDZ9_9AGAM|nr:hypothetical protein AZE42_03824 [Rhizopogon vesiculosus]